MQKLYFRNNTIAGNVGQVDSTRSGAGKGETTGDSGVCTAGKTGEYAAAKPEKRNFGFTSVQPKRDKTGCTTEGNAGSAPNGDLPKKPAPVVVVRDENVEAIEPVNSYGITKRLHESSLLEMATITVF